LARALRPPQVVKWPQTAHTHKNGRFHFERSVEEEEKEEEKMVESIKLLCLYGNEGNALFICLIKEKFKWSGGSSERIKTGGNKVPRERTKEKRKETRRREKKQGGWKTHSAPRIHRSLLSIIDGLFS
jgi:hypothetical protein